MRKNSVVIMIIIGVVFLLFCCLCMLFSLGLSLASNFTEWMGVDVPFQMEESLDSPEWEWEWEWEEESDSTPEVQHQMKKTPKMVRIH